MPLGSMDYVAVAAPGYADQHCPQGLSPLNFRSLSFVAFNHKDDLQCDFVGRVLRLKQVALRQFYVPSSEGQVRAVLAGWGVSILPEMLVRDQLQTGQLVNVAPGHVLPVDLYWHCWSLDSAVLDGLTHALTSASTWSLRSGLTKK